MPTWKIEGEWTGYTSRQRRVVHREYTTSEQRAKGAEELGYIRYSDGTGLYLTVEKKGRGKREHEIHGYTSLISDCIREGVSSVNELQSVKKARSAINNPKEG